MSQVRAVLAVDVVSAAVYPQADASGEPFKESGAHKIAFVGSGANRLYFPQSTTNYELKDCQVAKDVTFFIRGNRLYAMLFAKQENAFYITDDGFDSYAWRKDGGMMAIFRPTKKPSAAGLIEAFPAPEGVEMLSFYYPFMLGRQDGNLLVYRLMGTAPENVGFNWEQTLEYNNGFLYTQLKFSSPGLRLDKLSRKDVVYIHDSLDDGPKVIIPVRAVPDVEIVDAPKVGLTDF